MIVYARTKEVLIKGKDSVGDEQYFQVTGEDRDSLKTRSILNEELLGNLLLELRRMNIHLSHITDERINNNDLTEETIPQ